MRKLENNGDYMYLPPLEIALYMPWTHNTHVIWDVDAEEKMASWQAFAKGIK